MAAKGAIVRARVDPRLKEESEIILQRLGLSTTDAIRMMLAQVRLRGALPFHVTLESVDSANDDLLLPVSKRQAALDSMYDD